MVLKKLKVKLLEKDLSIPDLAERMGISFPTLYRKLNDPQRLTLKDIFKIAGILELTRDECKAIFLYWND